ncbi:MAG TPA: septum formation initiator family protein [Acidimicrobiales bacterium]
MAPPTKKISRAERHRSRNVRRTRFMLAGAVVLSAGILVAWFPAGALYHQRASLAGSQAQLAQLHSQDAALTQERKELSSNSEISRIARQQYQLVNPGQEAFEILPPAGTGSATAPFAGDPGTQGPVAPSGSSELTSGASTTTTTPTTNKAAVQSSASLLNRMLHALEFWR